jgi:predicted site-specific integrase-resolvase
MKYVSLPEMAKIIGVCNRTMWTYAKEKMIPGFKTPRGHWRFDQEKVIRSLEAKTNKPQPQI